MDEYKHEAQTTLSVPIENSMNCKKDYDRRNMLENEDDFVFDGNRKK